MAEPSFPSSFPLDGRTIGAGAAPYVIAEVSGNHNKDLGRALAFIDAAKTAGADAVKFQTYTADALALPSKAPAFQIETGPWTGRSLYDLYQEAATPYDWFPKLFERGRSVGITVFSSPFDEAAVDLLEGLNAPAYKIASNELTHWPLIQRAAATGRPLILSTGAARLSEIEATVDFLKRIKAPAFALLHCVSAYPTAPAEANLARIPDLAARFGVPVGFSDHTTGLGAPIAAAALGAAIIEKHVALDRNEAGPDAAFAMDMTTFAIMVEAVREASAARGAPVYGKTPAEAASPVYRRRFYAARDIAAGEALSADNLRAIRAPDGLLSQHFERIYGRPAAVAIPAHAPLTWAMVDGASEAEAAA